MEITELSERLRALAVSIRRADLVIVVPEDRVNVRCKRNVDMAAGEIGSIDPGGNRCVAIDVSKRSNVCWMVDRLVARKLLREDCFKST